MLYNGFHISPSDIHLVGLYFGFGLIIGSFITVFTLRVPQRKNFFFGRSCCNSCFKPLGFWDLVPIFSWLYLFGKCRYCNNTISIRYPIIEFFTSVVFAYAQLSRDSNSLLIFMFFLSLASCLISIIVLDIERNRIPNALIYCIGLMSAAIGWYLGYSFLCFFVSLIILALVSGSTTYISKVYKTSNILAQPTFMLAIALLPALTLLHTCILLILYYCVTQLLVIILRWRGIFFAIPKNAILALLGLGVVLSAAR